MSGKVLMLSYYYPPLGGIGTIRSLKFANYLPEFGWRPVVLTPEQGVHSYYCERGEGDLPGVEVVRTGYCDLAGKIRGLFQVPRGAGDSTCKAKGSGSKGKENCLIKLAKEWLFFPDEHTGWYYHALKNGLKVAGGKDVTALFSTSSPVTAHLVAHAIKHKTGLPWVADMRDLWTQNPYYTKNALAFRLEKAMERHILGYADALVTVSAPMAARLAELHKKEVFVITNGFDDEDYKRCPAQPGLKFTITYTGQLYNLRRSPEPLFKALASLDVKKAIDLNRVEVRFFGEIDPELQVLAERYEMLGSLTAPGLVSYNNSLNYQVGSTVLLLLEWGRRDSGDIYTGKFFEYLGARRPVLAITREGSVVADLLHEANAGEAIAMDQEGWQDKLEEILLRWYREFTETGLVRYHGKENVIQRYTRKKTAGDLAALLDKTCLNKKNPCKGYGQIK